MCDFNCDNETKIEDHIRTAHKQTKFTCNICKSSFKTHATLKEHKTKQHEAPTFPCDYCGNKSVSLNKLDEHIESYHRIKKDNPAKYQDRDVRSDKDQGRPKKIFTPQQRIENGPCKAWNESSCRFSDLCRWAHIEPCWYQEWCRASVNCRFFHYNKCNKSFLGGKSYRSSFEMNQEDFPPLHPQTMNQGTQRNHS